MKRILLLFLSFAFMTSVAVAQTFDDDFESYASGDYLAASNAEWTTWGGTTGTAEDVRVSDEQASSGTNSIKLQSTSANGGPQDLVKYFTGAKLSTGLLNTRMKMYVESGAYFNYQGEVAIGNTWSMNAFFEANGVGRITNSGNQNVLTFSYPEGQWFDFNMAINFDANKWQLEVNGVCVGSFANPDNSIASIDIFPLSGNLFYIDDFGYDYVADAPEIKDDAIAVLNASDLSGLAGNKIELGGTFTNGGSTVIESFEVEASANGEIIPFAMNGLTLEKGESMDFTITDSYILADGVAEVSLSIKSVNGGSFDDEDQCNDKSTLILFGTVPAEHTKVIVEEATGTWCGWCPRGAVALERLTYKYPERFIGIAVHNGDPMTVTEYDSGLAATGFPNAVVNRNEFIDPSAIEGPFLQEVQEESVAMIRQGAAWDPDTRELSISMKVTALQDLSSHKINVAITENGVTGTGSGYAQANYYSGSNDLIDINGVNYKDLPSTIPAADMVYDHVARAILEPFEGLDDSFENGLLVGDEKIFNFTYTVPAGFNVDEMHIISMIINPNGSINTGDEDSVEEAIANGFEEFTSTHDIDLTNATSVFPNPFTNQTNVNINLSEAMDVNLSIVDMSGKLMMTKTYNAQNGLFRVAIDGSTLPTGMYVLKIRTGNKYTTKRLSVIR